MNQLMLVVVALVALCYFGGKFCPSVLRQNKEMLLGVAVGLVLCSFMGLRLEGLTYSAYQKDDSEYDRKGDLHECLVRASHGGDVSTQETLERACLNVWKNRGSSATKAEHAGHDEDSTHSHEHKHAPTIKSPPKVPASAPVPTKGSTQPADFWSTRPAPPKSKGK
jgi:hypothetical protein